jgi:uncharacterized membrane protein
MSNSNKIKQSLSAKARRLFNYFLKGLLISLPIYATYRIIRGSLETLDAVLPFETIGLGFIIVISTITLLGFIGTTIITRPIIDLMDDLFSKIPLVKVIYTSIKDLIEAFVGDKKKFNKPVLVELTPGIFKPGFVTQDDLAFLGLPGLLAVYLPHSYAFSGNVFLVEKQKIKIYEGESGDLMKFIVSGGIIQNEDKNK